MPFSRRQLLVYVALGVVVVAVGARFLATSGSSAEGGHPGGVVVAASPPAVEPSAAAPSRPAELVVHVSGAVVRPGVYHLPPDARVCDAVERAGGATGKAELSAVNLAARLSDGQQVFIPEQGAAVGGSTAGGPVAVAGTAGAAGGGAPGSTTALVNLNTATLEELDSLTGVGPATAQKIIDFRQANGGFTSVQQLLEVPGIGDVKFAALKDQVTI